MMKPHLVMFGDGSWAIAKRHADSRKLSVSDWLRALVMTDAFEEHERRRRRDISQSDGVRRMRVKLPKGWRAT